MKRVVSFQSPNPPRVLGIGYTSYLTFSFWLLHQNEEEQYRALHDVCPDSDGYSICFVLQPAYFVSRYERSVHGKWSDSNATVCLIWVSGWGGTVKEAHDRWQISIRDLARFFTDRRSANGASERTGITVSDQMQIQVQFSPFPRQL